MNSMKRRTPYYYKNFKCIAGDCRDTCCAGWDVDVDEKSYRFYRKVKGDFGKRLKSVMVPDSEGGCTFTLTDDNRCPFLNDSNLCDLYIALGEEHLCETCDEFPRFINEYGSLREVGLAPSCITAGEIMFADRQRMHFDEEEDGRPVDMYNDIDGFLYLQLNNARNTAFDIIDMEDFTTDEVCVILLEYAKKIQWYMDRNMDNYIPRAIDRFKDSNYLKKLVEKKREEISRETERICIDEFFNSFKGMEIINPDWLKYTGMEKHFEEKLMSDIGKNGHDNESFRECDGIPDIEYNRKYAYCRREFDKYYGKQEFRYRQLLDYYVYRYFIDAVNDFNIVLKMKNALVGYLVVKHLDMVVWDASGKLDYDEFVDIAHLYSRQFEHSYTNYERYSSFFMKKSCYSIKELEQILMV